MTGTKTETRMNTRNEAPGAGRLNAVCRGVCLCSLALASAAAGAADGLHNADFVLAVEGGRIVTGAVGDDGSVVFPSRVRSAVMGSEGFPNFTNDPGFTARLGDLIPGMPIGFTILGAPRVWDADEGDFDTIAGETLTVRAAGQNIDAPAADTPVVGIVFGEASQDAGASFHHHMQYLLNGGQPPMVDGVWLLTLELWTTVSGVAPTEPLYLVFAQGEGGDELAAAIEYVERELVGLVCVADLTGDGVLDFFDVSAFLTAYGSGDPAADLTGDGVLSFFDVSAFLTAYAEGCP